VPIARSSPRRQDLPTNRLMEAIFMKTLPQCDHNFVLIIALSIVFRQSA